MRHIRFALLGLLLVVVGAARAQGTLQPDGEAEAGVVAIQPGFAPDPLRVPALTGGGKVDAVQRQLGPDCAGFISETPDVRISLGGALPLLRLIFIADAVTVDTTMVVYAPDGTYWCGNNTNGLFNPMVTLPRAVPGDYAVWIGGFTPETPVFGELFVTTNAEAMPGSTGLMMPVATSVPTAVPAGLLTPTPVPGTFLDPTLPPAHADVALAHGFLPDPFRAIVVGGGELAVPPLDQASPAACAGYVTSAPDLRLEWSGASPRLRFHVRPSEPGVDAGLVVHTPDGRWLCNADFAPGYSDPSVEVLDPVPGTYTVWASNEASPGARYAAALYVTEITSTPETVETAGTPSLPLVAGLDPSAAGMAVRFDETGPDPLALSAPTGFPGGSTDLVALNPPLEGQRPSACLGYATTAPTLTVDLAFPYPYLRVFFVGAEGTDATLVVRMPNGEWYCNDDSFDSKNPTIDIIGPSASGQAQIWIGNFSAPDTPTTGTVYLTRGSATPADPTAGTAFIGLTELAISPVVTLAVYPTALPPSTGPLTPGAAPNYGSAALASADPPYTVAVIGGGEQDASKASAECVGAVSAQPDFGLDWQGAAVPLRLFVTGEGDPTLIVYGPDGVLRCADDSLDSVFPILDLPAALAGSYAIWVGSFDPAVSAPGVLHISSDLNRSPENP